MVSDTITSSASDGMTWDLHLDMNWSDCRLTDGRHDASSFGPCFQNIAHTVLLGGAVKSNGGQPWVGVSVPRSSCGSTRRKVWRAWRSWWTASVYWTKILLMSALWEEISSVCIIDWVPPASTASGICPVSVNLVKGRKGKKTVVWCEQLAAVSGDNNREIRRGVGRRGASSPLYKH